MVIALRNLFRNKVRSFITVLSASVGIGILVALITLSQGLKEQLQGIIEKYNIDVTIQSKDAATPFASRIEKEEYIKLRATYGKDNISAMVIGPTKSKFRNYQLIIGISSNEAIANRVGILDERLLQKTAVK
ncbi:MAG: ABC transporter permease [Spirochaetota bacterium]|nr:ABC transporter permease [Spirochaetota bacterium]